jgi:hypothetical protein
MRLASPQRPIPTKETTMICEAIHCFDRQSVRFAFYPAGFDGPRVLAEISEDALRDHFGARGGPEGLLETCARHFEIIERAALDCHRDHPDRAILLQTADFSCATLAG